MNQLEWEIVWSVGLYIAAVAIVALCNIAALVGAVWVVVKMLQWMGVI